MFLDANERISGCEYVECKEVVEDWNAIERGVSEGRLRSDDARELPEKIEIESLLDAEVDSERRGAGALRNKPVTVVEMEVREVEERMLCGRRETWNLGSIWGPVRRAACCSSTRTEQGGMRGRKMRDERRETNCGLSLFRMSLLGRRGR